MPWPEGTPAWLKNQWGVISGQVSERATTAQLVDSLRAYAAASPEGWGPRGVIVLQQLRSVATSIRNAADSITKTGFTGTISSEHIATAPWSRSEAQQQLAPRFMVRALVTSATAEAVAGVPGAAATQEQWVTQYASTLPATLDQLVESIIGTAGETGSPPTPVQGVGRIEILRE